MTVIFENESGRDFGLPLESLAQEILEAAMDYAKVSLRGPGQSSHDR